MSKKPTESAEQPSDRSKYMPPYYIPYYQQAANYDWGQAMANGRRPKSSGCCGGGCHVKHAATYVSMIEFVFVATILAIFIQYYVSLENKTTLLTVGFGFSIGSAAIGLLVILCLLVGVCRESYVWLVPHLVGQVVAICLMTAIGALILLMIFTGVKFDPYLGAQFPATFMAIAVLCLGMSLAEIWFFFIVRDCYIYLKKLVEPIEYEKEKSPAKEGALGARYDPSMRWYYERFYPQAAMYQQQSMVNEENSKADASGNTCSNGPIIEDPYGNVEPRPQAETKTETNEEK